MQGGCGLYSAIVPADRLTAHLDWGGYTQEGCLALTQASEPLQVISV